MTHFRIENMLRGWFVGSFSPTALSTDACEVALKSYIAGEKEDIHFHKIATEITLIIKGRVRMLDREFSDGDIVVIEPYTATDFIAITDTVTVVVKVPGALNDKFPGAPEGFIK